MNKKKKVISAVTALILLLIVGGISLHQSKVTAQESKEQQAQTEIQEALSLTKKNMELLYADDETKVLSDTITKDKIMIAEHSLETVSALKLNKEQEKKLPTISHKIATAKQLFSIQSSIHKKFKDGKIVSDSVEFSKEEKELDSFKKSHPIFFKTITKTIEQAKKQLTLKKELQLFFEDFDKLEVKETVSRSDYDHFKAKVDSLTSKPFKSALTEALDAIKKAGNKKLLKEKETKEEKKSNDEAVKESDATKIKEESEKQLILDDSNSSDTASKESKKSQATSDSAISSIQPTPDPQTGIEKLITRSSTSNYTSQILGVVASGSSSTVYLFEKNNDQWQTVLSVPGRVGYNGVGSSYEGSGRTPKGAYSLGFAFGTGPNPGTNLTYKQITDKSYWISNPDDTQYNTWQERSSSSSLDEHMSDYQMQYKYGITLNYNNGVNGGSAFFVHVNGNGSTAGCISVSESTMLYLMKHIKNGAYIINVNSESELANY